jgi:hypothetical protein
VRAEEVRELVVSSIQYHFYPFFLGAVCRTVVAIDSYESPSKNYESVKARYPDIILSDFCTSGMYFEIGDQHLEKKRKVREAGS